MITKEFLTEKGITDEAIVSSILDLYDKGLKKEASNAVSNMLNAQDKIALEKTGIQKPDGMQTSAYWEYALSEKFKKDYEKNISEKEAKISELDALIKSGTSDKVINENKALLAELEKERKAFSDFKESSAKEKQKFEFEMFINSKMPTSFKKEFPADYIEFEKNKLKEKISGYTLGKNEKGEDIIKHGENEGFRTSLLSEFINENLKHITETTQAAGGTGGSGSGGGGGSEHIVSSILQSDTPQVKEQKIEAYLLSKGMNKVSKEYREDFAELYKKYVLTK